jgi:flagellar biosynthesis anti-sigma factor FlgM
MHISNAQIQKALELSLHRVHVVRPAGSCESASQPDRLTLSRKATEVQQIKQALSTMPSTREGVVRNVSRKLRSGDYKVNEQELADKMLDAARVGRSTI